MADDFPLLSLDTAVSLHVSDYLYLSRPGLPAQDLKAPLSLVMAMMPSSNYVLAAATDLALGGVQPDGLTITVDGSGIISATAGAARTQQKITAAGTTAHPIAATASLVVVYASATGTKNFTLPNAPVGSIDLENRKTDSAEAARVLHITPAAGHTIEGQSALEHDTGFATLTLFGTDWTITG